MAKCHRNDVGSLMLDRPTTTSGGHFRLWTAFSASSFRRKIFDAVSCGGSSRYRHHGHDDVADAPIAAPAAADGLTAILPEEKPKPKPRPKKSNGKSEKLSDLLNMADWSESEADVAATKKKVEALEELKRVVRDLQADDSANRTEAASRVRSLAKENLDARGTLAMLGAIPPLVGMLDSGDVDAQIASLYALLNLGIGNDV